MKKLTPLLFIVASCTQSKYVPCPKYVGVAIDTIPVRDRAAEKAERLYSYSWLPCREYYDEIHVEDSVYRPLHCIVTRDTLTVKVRPFFDTLFTKAKVIVAGGKVFKVSN